MCQCCDEMCKSFNQACGDVCKSIRECWAPIVDNPLGMFVLGTWGFQGMIILCGGYAISGVADECIAEDDDPGSIRGFLFAMIVFAIIHCAFAYYIQRRLVNDIQNAPDDEKVSKLVWEILKRDIPFCLYFFMAIGAFFVACWGYSNVSSTDKCGGKVQTGSGGVVGLAICFGMLSPCYGCCFVCGKATNDTVSSAKGKVQEGKDCAAGATKVGKSAGPAA
jgi:hypothetical protein